MPFTQIYKNNQAIEEIHAIEKKYSLMNKHIQLPHEEECQKDYHQNSNFA